jgi:hypothetical protein
MSTEFDCHEIRRNLEERRTDVINIDNRLTRHEGRLDAMGERLNEVLESIQANGEWVRKWVPVMFLVMLLGDKAIPFLGKILT